MAEIDVPLSDGRIWSLRMDGPAGEDPTLDALLACVIEAEDQAEVARAELALTIYLLDKNYRLGPNQLALLLTFQANDPDLAALQKAIHDAVLQKINTNLADSTAHIRSNHTTARTSFIQGPT